MITKAKLTYYSNMSESTYVKHMHDYEKLPEDDLDDINLLIQRLTVVKNGHASGEYAKDTIHMTIAKCANHATIEQLKTLVR